VISISEAFRATSGFKVPDETYVFPFLNSNDVTSGLMPGLLDAFSLAIGEIEAGSASKVHVHPVVTQVTMVLDGRLEVRLRDETAEQPYTLYLAQHQAALVRPGAFLQLINASRFPCRTLYIVGPSYVFDVNDDGNLLYDDAIALDESWEKLEALNWQPPRLGSPEAALQDRMAALERIRGRTTLG
jgi:hypothetical protein